MEYKVKGRCEYGIVSPDFFLSFHKSDKDR